MEEGNGRGCETRTRGSWKRGIVRQGKGAWKRGIERQRTRRRVMEEGNRETRMRLDLVGHLQSVELHHSLG